MTPDHRITRSLRSATSRIASAFLLTGALACSSDKGTGPDGPLTAPGFYRLTHVEGKPLPAVTDVDPNNRRELLSGSISVHPDSGYALVLQWRYTSDAGPHSFADTTYGSWVAIGTAVTFENSEDTGPLSATITRAGLSVDDPGEDYTYDFRREAKTPLTPLAPASATLGVYPLRTVNGSGLPFTLEDGPNGKIEILSGELRLETGRRFRVLYLGRYTEAGSTYTYQSVGGGDWVLNGANITFTDHDGYTFRGTLSGGVVTLLDDTYVLKFRR